jgi:hypothetical protein
VAGTITAASPVTAPAVAAAPPVMSKPMAATEHAGAVPAQPRQAAEALRPPMPAAAPEHAAMAPTRPAAPPKEDARARADHEHHAKEVAVAHHAPEAPRGKKKEADEKAEREGKGEKKAQ